MSRRGEERMLIRAYGPPSPLLQMTCRAFVMVFAISVSLTGKARAKLTEAARETVVDSRGYMM